MNLERHFSDRARRMSPLAIRDILRRGDQPDIIPFIAGQPVPGLFPLRPLGQLANQLQDVEALQYGNSEGKRPLRDRIAERIPGASGERTLIISGSQQALDLTAKLFIMPGDKVAVAEPTYSGAISTFQVYGAQLLGVACDDEGMVLEALEQALAQGAKLIYAIPNFMNPTGVDMSLARRQAVVALARQYNVVVLEDDPYGALRFDGEPKPNLLELAPERVIYASTFSKTLAPGLRLAWLVAPDWAWEKLVIGKQTADLQSPTYLQQLVYDLLEDDFLERQISQLCAYYRQQRDWLLAAMDAHFPAGARYGRPAGGMFVWCELPPHLNATALLEEALAQKVAYMPGAAFYPNGGGDHTLRLSFTLATAAQMEVGAARLGRIFGKKS